MRMYPAYRLHHVLNMRAVTFFALLNDGYRLQNQHYLMIAQLNDLPNMDADTRKQIYKNLEYASQHPSDILKPSGEGSSPTEIKRMLGG